MKQMDDVWKDISSLSSVVDHHPATTTTRYFQDFFAPATTPPLTTTMLRLSSTASAAGNSAHGADDDQEQLPHATSSSTLPNEHNDNFKRLMRNRESASRSRARKQARMDELEHEVLRLKKENVALKRLQKELCSTSPTQVSKKKVLERSKSAPP